MYSKGRVHLCSVRSVDRWMYARYISLLLRTPLYTNKSCEIFFPLPSSLLALLCYYISNRRFPQTVISNLHFFFLFFKFAPTMMDVLCEYTISVYALLSTLLHTLISDLLCSFRAHPGPVTASGRLHLCIVVHWRCTRNVRPFMQTTGCSGRT